MIINSGSDYICNFKSEEAKWDFFALLRDFVLRAMPTTPPAADDGKWRALRYVIYDQGVLMAVYKYADTGAPAPGCVLEQLQRTPEGREALSYMRLTKKEG